MSPDLNRRLKHSTCPPGRAPTGTAKRASWSHPYKERQEDKKSRPTYRLRQSDITLPNLGQLGLPILQPRDGRMVQDLAVRDGELGQPGNDVVIGHGGHGWIRHAVF